MTPMLTEEAEAVTYYFMTVTVKNGILPYNIVISINCSNVEAITNTYYKMKAHITCGLT
jgi:hypothetical protein